MRAAAILTALLAAAGSARAEVTDATLRAASERVVRLEVDGVPDPEGRLLGFDDASVTIADAATGEVVSVPRADVVRIFLLDPVRPEARRIVGLQVSPLGTLAVDAERGWLRGFASASLLMPILTASGDSAWWAAAIGAGVSLPVSRRSRWRLDVFGAVLPLRVTSFYTYLGFGIGGGMHYTARSGFAVGFTFPVLGFATRLGSSPTGYDAPFRYNDSLGYYYLAAIAGLPLFTMGYRF